MKGRPVEYNDKEVVLNAQKIFWEKGYTSTSMNDLKNATQLGSGSLYNAFKGGKKELFSKSIQQRRLDFEDFRRELSKSKNPLGMITNFFLKLADADVQVHRRGCIIANSVTELAFVDEDLEKEAIQILLDVEEMFTEAIVHAQQHNLTSNTTNAKILGRYLVTLWNGLNVTRRIHPETATLKSLIKFQLSIF